MADVESSTGRGGFVKFSEGGLHRTAAEEKNRVAIVLDVALALTANMLAMRVKEKIRVNLVLLKFLLTQVGLRHRVESRPQRRHMLASRRLSPRTIL